MSGEIDPRILLEASILVERDLSIFTGPELLAKYLSEDDKRVFHAVTGRPVSEVAADHNPFWHYALQTWYRPERYRKLLYAPRHRAEVADAVVRMAIGKLDSYDGIHHQYPRRGLKSFFAKMAADWLPKRHKIVDNLDILVLYSHNLDSRAKSTLESIKNMNRHNAYIGRHFGPDCVTVTGRPANFVIPMSEWGEKSQWDWPCRDPQWMVNEKNMTADAALSRKAGAGYNYKILDDWEAEDSRDSEAIREELADKYDQLRQLNAPPFAREWSCGTPYHIQSLYKPMIEERHDDGTPRYFVIKCPALTDGKPNFPTIPRLSVENLAKERANEIRRRGTDRFFFLQYMLDPTLTGETAMQWEFFQPLTPKEFADRFGNLPRFRCVYIDPAWKGDDNHQEGSDAVIATIDSYSIAGQMDFVLLDGVASSDMESDEGGDEILRQMVKWHTHMYVIEQQADKPMVGFMKRLWKTTPMNARPSMMPRYIQVTKWSRKAKNDRISAVAGQAKMGHWYYLDTITPEFKNTFKKTVDEYPACAKRDTLDAMANAQAEEVLSRWVPISIPEQTMKRERQPIMYATRYTGLPAVGVH